MPCLALPCHIKIPTYIQSWVACHNFNPIATFLILYFQTFSYCWVEPKWSLSNSVISQFYLSLVKCSMERLLSSARKLNTPNMAWCYEDTSSRRSRGYHLVVCACWIATKTSDAKVLTTSFPSTCVNWTTEPRKPDLKITFLTLIDCIFDATWIEASLHNKCRVIQQNKVNKW